MSESVAAYPKDGCYLSGSQVSIHVANEKRAGDNIVMRISRIVTTTAMLGALLCACSAGDESEEGAGRVVPDAGAPDVVPDDSDASLRDVRDEGGSPPCIDHQTTIRLTGRTIGEDIPDGPVLIAVYEDQLIRCGGSGTPGAPIGQFETTLGQDFDFEVVVTHASDEPPYLSVLALVDVDGADWCDPGEDAMGALWIPPHQTSGLILELTAGLCYGLI